MDGSGNTITTYQSEEICDAYAALAEAGYTCVRENDCVTACEYDASLSGSKYKCKIADFGVGTACTDWDDHKIEKTAFIPATLNTAEVPYAAAYTSYHAVSSGSCADAGYADIPDETECLNSVSSSPPHYISSGIQNDAYGYGSGQVCQEDEWGNYLYSNQVYVESRKKACKLFHPEVQYAAATYNDDAVAATYTYYSVEVCDAYGALKQAERAELDAMRTCSVSSNCVDDTSVGSNDDNVNH